MTRPAPLLTTILLISLLAPAACTPRRGTSQEIAADLQSYSAQMQRWETKEKSIFQAIDDVEESQYVDDEFVLRTLKGALPALDEHVREVAAYRPLTPDLAKLHEHYRRGWEDLRAALDVMIAAETKKDYLELARGKSRLQEARATLLQAFAGMDALMQENEQLLKHTNRS